MERSRLGNAMDLNAVASSTAANVNASVSSDGLLNQVQGLIDEAGTVGVGHERRLRDRFPIPFTFRLTPIGHDGKLLMEESTTVVGKDISLSGIGFSHDHPLPYRRAIVSLDHPKVGRFAVEAEIVWTKPTPIGPYESGCRLVRTVDGHIVRPKG
jgi:hypothetical protein